MYVCVCKAVTERQIEHAVERGARDMRALRMELGVSTECGRCGSCAHRCLAAALDARAARDWRDKALQALSAVLPHELETQ